MLSSEGFEFNTDEQLDLNRWILCEIILIGHSIAFEQLNCKSVSCFLNPWLKTLKWYYFLNFQEKYKEKEQKQKKLNAEQATKESTPKGEEYEVSWRTKETTRVMKLCENYHLSIPVILFVNHGKKSKN